MSLTWSAAVLRHTAPTLYYAPQLWGTTDGVISYRRFWPEYVLMSSALARQRLQVGAAVTLALGGEDMDGERTKARALAFPELRGGE